MSQELFSNIIVSGCSLILGYFFNELTSRRRRLKTEQDHEQTKRSLGLLLRAAEKKGWGNFNWGPNGEPLGDIENVVGEVILEMGGGAVHQFKPKVRDGNMSPSSD